MAGKIRKGPDFHPIFNNTTLGDFFFTKAEEYGNKICQIDADLDKSETFKSVKQRSIRLAVNLQKKGVTSQDVICFCSFNSLDITIAIIASFYLGAKVANLDPTLSVRTAKHLLNLVKPKIIFVDEKSINMIEECNPTSEIITFGKNQKYENFFDLVKFAKNEEEFKPTKVDINDTAVIFFSSGTTGFPKGITHSHYTFLLIINILLEAVGDWGNVSHITTFYSISGMTMLIRGFVKGNSRIFFTSFKGEQLLEAIEKYKINTIFMSRFNTYQLIKLKNLENYDISSLWCLLTGGNTMSIEHYKNLTQKFPTVKILYSYGLTEIGKVAIFNPTKHQTFMKTKFGSCGKIVPGMSLKIVNPDTEELLGVNQKGEIRLKSKSVMTGYYKMDTSSFFDSDGFLKTGDIGYYDTDECVYVIDRIKEIIRYKGWDVVPSLIEAVILEHWAVKEVVVFGVSKGEDGQAPAACVVLKENCNIDEEEIEKFVEGRVSDREKLRGGVIFVECLPRTPTGKLSRNEIRKLTIK